MGVEREEIRVAANQMSLAGSASQGDRCPTALRFFISDDCQIELT